MDDVASLMEAGRAARQQGRRADALALFARAQAADPSHLPSLVEHAQELLDAGCLPEARAAFAEALRRAPGNVRALLGLGFAARRSGDHAEAASRFAAAVGADPRQVRAKLELAQSLLDTDRLAEAADRYRDVVAAEPNQPRAHLGLGIIARRTGDRAAAAAHFAAAVAADPRHLNARIELAAEQRELGRLEEAEASLAAALAIDPAHVPAWIQRGLVARHRGDRPAAREAFRQALTLRPGTARILAELAREELALGQPEAAAEALDQALAAEPAHLDALLLRAELAMIAEDLDTCLAHCRRAAEAHPAAPRPHAMMVGALANSGRAEEALALLDQALERFGPDAALRVKRLEILRATGRYDALRAGLAVEAEAIATHPGIWSAAFRLEMLEGRHAAAAALLAAAPARSLPEQARLALFRGQLAEAEWDLPAARRHYAEALRLNPEDGWTHMEMARASMLAVEVEAARHHLGRSVGAQASARILRGQPIRTSQTHLGQILDEFLLDQDALRRLADLQAAPPGGRIAPLMAMVRENPDHTPTAIQLLLALRQAGMLDAPAPGEGAAPAIPRRIAQFWTGGEPPGDLRPLMRSWQERNPGTPYLRFDGAAAERFLQDRHAPEVLEAFRRADSPAKAADLFRLAWLLAEGGFYADADDRCLAPLDGLLAGPVRLVLYQEDLGTLGNNMIAAAPGHPVIARALAMAVEALNRGDSDLLWLSTGPGLVSRAFAATLAERPEHLAAFLAETRILGRGALGRVVACHCAAQYKTTRRHWSRSAFARKLPQAAEPSPPPSAPRPRRLTRTGITLPPAPAPGKPG